MIKIKFYKIVLFLPFIIFFIGLFFSFSSLGQRAVSFRIGDLGIFIGIILMLINGLTIRCPTCGKSPFVYGKSELSQFFFRSPWPESICSRCGTALES
jgi:hypothetical protein